MAEIVGVPALFTGLVDLASRTVGGRALLCSDDYFAGMEHLLNPEPARFDPSTYTDRGKEMDGWESRRKRVPGHDWCIVKLGVPGLVRAVDVDTSHFLGNHGPFASVEGTNAADNATGEWLRDHANWSVIVPETPMKRGSSNVCASVSTHSYTHVRLNMVPDGGIARLRVYGVPVPEATSGRIDLAALAHGGCPLVASDSFFSPMGNLVLPGESPIMSNGWETRRSRPPGMDWIILRLGQPGRLDSLTVQTHHFKGNYPDRAAIDALYWPGAPPSMLVSSHDWQEILAPHKLHAHDSRDFAVARHGPWTHLRLRIYPDGGISRLRAWGHPSHEVANDPLVERLNHATSEELARACGSSRWVAAFAAGRPYQSRAQLFGEAERRWWRLDRADWLEAFTHHPKIGADIKQLREKFASTATWSANEQAGVARAGEATLQSLAHGNQAYEAKFGHIFIVCASGLGADEMLARLQERMDNRPDEELRIAAGEQAKITRLRLEKLG